MAEKSYTLADLYAHLSPDGLGNALKDETRRQLKQTDSRSLLEELMRLCLDPTGIFYSAEDIKTSVGNYFTSAKSQTTVDEKTNAKVLFHMIGSKGIGAVDFGDKSYWGDAVSSIESIVPSIKLDNDQKVAAFITRSPFMTPATRGTSDVDFFINYIPPIIASQMVPYLDVEFELSRGSSEDNISSPSIMRFLLGAKAEKVSQLSEFDKALEKSGIHVSKVKNKNKTPETTSEAYAFTGMEMFLMPQTLTNMDALGPTRYRLAPAKPFLPFASIEGFDVQVQNAGAGKFAHKTGTLRMKIHDKARISEFSEFIKGSSGYNRAIIWTTYGWVAPRFDEKSVVNDYAKFINDKMMIRECWQVVNPQFTFDAAGQVSLTLSLVSKSQRKIQETEVGSGVKGNNAKEAIVKFNDLLKRLRETKEQIDYLLGEKKFAIDVQATQVLNAASTTGDIANIEKINDIVKNLLTSLNGKLDSDKLSELSKDLEVLKNKGGPSSIKQRNESIADGVNGRINQFAEKGNDPFLPTPQNAKDYGGLRLLEVISKFSSRTDAANAKIKTDNKKTPNPLLNKKILPKAKVVSFGRLFLDFVAPALVNKENCDELQVFFYGLNDQCGPVSDHSIAEFPIDMLKFEYAYAEAIKNAGNDCLTLEQFMTIVIQTQFDDESSIAYGMNEMYEPANSEEPNVVKRREDEKIASQMAAWTRDYGALRRPIIEMYMESGEKGHANESIVQSLKRGAYRLQAQEDNPKLGGKYIIKRIHIYDKQCNPYKLFQQIISSGNNDFSLAAINKNKVASAIDGILGNLKDHQITKLKELLKGSTNPADIKNALKSVGVNDNFDDMENDVSLFDKPMGLDVRIKGDPKSIKQQLMRFVPNIVIGTNGTMVISANMSSKTDGLQGAINMMNAKKGQKGGSAAANNSSADETPRLPTYTVPAQLTMTTMGVPTAQLYQQYFVDFNTGTTLDNLYTCTQMQHSIASGKFTTNWTFAYTDGYGKFTAPASIGGIRDDLLRTEVEALFKKVEEGKKKSPNNKQSK